MTALTSWRPVPPRMKKPPNMVPKRTAMKVPISMRPLPPKSSCLAKCCGRIEYLIGPKKADWVPVRNTAKSWSQT